MGGVLFFGGGVLFRNPLQKRTTLCISLVECRGIQSSFFLLGCNVPLFCSIDTTHCSDCLVKECLVDVNVDAPNLCYLDIKQRPGSERQSSHCVRTWLSIRKFRLFVELEGRSGNTCRQHNWTPPRRTATRAGLQTHPCTATRSAILSST